MDWVLIIFGTQVIKKKCPLRPVFPDYLSVSYDYATNNNNIIIIIITVIIITKGIFQRDSLSLLVFVLALIPLSFILRKAKATYEFSESKED